MTVTMRFEVTLPAPFHPVPSRSGQEFEGWAARVGTARTSEGADSTIMTDLQRLAAAMDASEEPDAQWFAAVTSAPYQLGIAAFGWVSASRAQGIAAEALAAHVPPGGIREEDESLVSQASLHEIGPNTALVISQLQAVEAEPSSVLIERCGALMLVPASDVLVRLELVAADMRAFDNIVATTVAVLESLAVTVSEA
jgi:hypothetical protein